MSCCVGLARFGPDRCIPFADQKDVSRLQYLGWGDVCTNLHEKVWEDISGLPSSYHQKPIAASRLTLSRGKYDSHTHTHKNFAGKAFDAAQSSCSAVASKGHSSLASESEFLLYIICHKAFSQNTSSQAFGQELVQSLAAFLFPLCCFLVALLFHHVRSLISETHPCFACKCGLPLMAPLAATLCNIVLQRSV